MSEGWDGMGRKCVLKGVGQGERYSVSAKVGVLVSLGR